LARGQVERVGNTGGVRGKLSPGAGRRGGTLSWMRSGGLKVNAREGDQPT